jgi:MFS family permease
MTQLIVFRAIQGIGAGALIPIGMTIIGDLFPPERSGKMQACSVPYCWLTCCLVYH